MALRIKRVDHDSPQYHRTQALYRYIEARKAEDQAIELRKKAEADLIAVLEAQELKSTSTEVEGVRYTTTVTHRTTTSFDEPGLKKALGAKTFNKLTVPKLDRDKLTEAIDGGSVDPALVSQYTTITPGARSVRLTRKVADDRDAEEA